MDKVLLDKINEHPQMFLASLRATTTWYGGRRYVCDRGQYKCNVSFKEIVKWVNTRPDSSEKALLVDSVMNLNNAGELALKRASCFARNIGIYIARFFGNICGCFNKTKEIANLQSTLKTLQASASQSTPTATQSSARTSSSSVASTHPSSESPASQVRHPKLTTTSVNDSPSGLPRLSPISQNSNSTPTTHTPSLNEILLTGESAQRRTGTMNLSTMTVKDQISSAADRETDPQFRVIYFCQAYKSNRGKQEAIELLKRDDQNDLRKFLKVDFRYPVDYDSQLFDEILAIIDSYEAARQK